MKNSRKNLLFVYGTLRKDANHPAHKIYLNHAEFVGYAKVRGELFMIDYYPGLVLGESDQWVFGEIYALNEVSDLERLDVYEACSANCAEPHEYQRVQCWVTLEEGEMLSAWTYHFIQSVLPFTKISSGDFMKLPIG